MYFRRCATSSCSTEPCTGYSFGTSIRAPTGSQLTGSKTNRKELSSVNDQAQPEVYPDRAFKTASKIIPKEPANRKQDFRKEYINRKQDYWNKPAIQKPAKSKKLIFFDFFTGTLKPLKSTNVHVSTYMYSLKNLWIGKLCTFWEIKLI